MTQSPPCWRTKTKNVLLAPFFVRLPEVVHFSIVIGGCLTRLVENVLLGSLSSKERKE